MLPGCDHPDPLRPTMQVCRHCEAMLIGGVWTARPFRGRAEHRYETFYCTCAEDGRRSTEEMLRTVYTELSTSAATLVTDVVISLNWDFDASIIGIGSDMWHRVDVESYDRSFGAYIQCDQVEHGFAGAWLAFAEYMPDHWREARSERSE